MTYTYLRIQKLTGESFIAVVKFSFENKCIKLLLLYKKLTLPITFHCDWLQGIGLNNLFDIILGDFNMNRCNETIC